MTIDLIGIVQDGTPQSPLLPQDPRKTITVPLNTSLTVRFHCYSMSGQKFDFGPAIGGGDVINLTVKKQIDDIPAIQVALVPDPQLGRGEGHFTISGTAWNLMDVGSYVYDIWLKNAKEPMLQASPFVVTTQAYSPAPIMD